MIRQSRKSRQLECAAQWWAIGPENQGDRKVRGSTPQHSSKFQFRAPLGMRARSLQPNYAPQADRRAQIQNDGDGK